MAEVSFYVDQSVAILMLYSQPKESKSLVEKPAGAEPEPVVALGTKHPLNDVWDLWYYKNVSSNFERNLFNITSVDTVEDFWGWVIVSIDSVS